MSDPTTDAETHDRSSAYHSRHKTPKMRHDHGDPTGLYDHRRLADAPCPRIVVETFNKEGVNNSGINSLRKRSWA